MLDVTEKMTPLEKEAFRKHQGKFPFPVISFANEIGVKVYADEKLPRDTSGAIRKVGNEYSVVLNANHSKQRILFTLAHELGHYFNDKDYLESNGEIEDSSKQSHGWLYRKEGRPCDESMRQRDVLANKFAAELLMPEKDFILQWKRHGSAEAVAKFFNVSVSAVQVRAASVLGEIV